MNSSPTSPTIPARRRWLFRMLAICMGFAPLLGAEVVLRCAGYVGRESTELDPFIEFEQVRPLFEPRDGGMAIPASRQEYFREEKFAHPKPPDEFRIVCLGGSTVQGRPFAIETSFTTWLELALKAAEPHKTWEVINCGGVSYASYRLKPILREMLQYHPDLVILYTGQNEFLEDRTYARWRQRPRWSRRAGKWLESSRVFRLAQSFGAAKHAPDRLSTEVDAMLDYRGGLDQYQRDDAWHEAIAEHYQWNVGQLIDECRGSGVPVIVCNPVVNLETPPFKSQPESLGAAQERFDELLATAAADATGSAASSNSMRIAALEEAVEISSRSANAWHHLGIRRQESHDHPGALAALIHAKDEDVCPLRMTEALYLGLAKTVLQRLDTPGPPLIWCDVRLAFTQDLPRVMDPTDDPRVASDAQVDWLFTPKMGAFHPLLPNAPQAVTGKRWMVDHVHPSINGHQWIAHWLALALQRGHWVKGVNTAESIQRRDAMYREHLNELSPLYFEQAKRRLEGLQRWSEGRAFKVKQTPGQAQKEL